MKYRKKPVPVEAWKIDPDNAPWRPPYAAPDWVHEAFRNGTCQWDAHCKGVLIKTLEGDMFGPNGDMLVQGVAGEVYCCRADIFERTYEPVEG